MQSFLRIFRQLVFALSGASLLLLGGCPAAAEHPFFDPEYCRVEEFLLGQWEVHEGAVDALSSSRVEVRAEADGRSMWMATVRRAGQPADAEPPSETPLHLWVAEFDGQIMMHTQEGDTHMLYAVTTRDGVISFCPLSSKWIRKQIEAKHLHLGAVKPGAATEEASKADDAAILVGHTEELQPLLHLAAQDPAAFRDDTCFYLLRSSSKVPAP